MIYAVLFINARNKGQKADVFSLHINLNVIKLCRRFRWPLCESLENFRVS